MRCSRFGARQGPGRSMRICASNALPAARHSGAVLGIAACMVFAPCAQAFVVTISNGSPRQIYLQVGVGSFSGIYSGSPRGTPLPNASVQTVSVTVPTAAVGSGTAQAMASNTGSTSSFYDNYVFCNAGQIYIGGFYRHTSSGSGSGATLSANSSAPLTNASGQTIPMTQISWTTSGNDGSSDLFAAGTFNGSTQTVGTIARNTWSESCMTFSYANSAVRAAGTYTATVTYTLTAP